MMGRRFRAESRTRVARVRPAVGAVLLLATTVLPVAAAVSIGPAAPAGATTLVKVPATWQLDTTTVTPNTTTCDRWYTTTAPPATASGSLTLSGAGGGGSGYSKGESPTGGKGGLVATTILTGAALTSPISVELGCGGTSGKAGLVPIYPYGPASGGDGYGDGGTSGRAVGVDGPGFYGGGGGGGSALCLGQATCTVPVVVAGGGGGAGAENDCEVTFTPYASGGTGGSGNTATTTASDIEVGSGARGYDGDDGHGGGGGKATSSGGGGSGWSSMDGAGGGHSPWSSDGGTGATSGNFWATASGGGGGGGYTGGGGGGGDACLASVDIVDVEIGVGNDAGGGGGAGASAVNRTYASGGTFTQGAKGGDSTTSFETAATVTCSQDGTRSRQSGCPGYVHLTWEVNETPTVASISPDVAPLGGGTRVTITGTYLAGATAVKFGTTPATTVVVGSATSITATVPAGTGTVDVTVTTSYGTSATTSADRFTYIPPPSVASVNPSSGPAVGGTAVTITGTTFTGATAVSFGGFPATFTVTSGTSIAATAPAVPFGRTVDVTVTTPYGTSPTSGADQFTYLSPTVSSLNPDGGPTAAGTAVTITGTRFTATTTLTFGGVPATTVVVHSATSITAVAPAAPLGPNAVAVTATSSLGTSPPSPGDQFTYFETPLVTSVTPSSGRVAGGNSVVVHGEALSGATQVLFGSTPATGLTDDSFGEVTVTAPPGTGTVDVTVTTPGGTSSPSTTDRYTYVPLPTVTGVTPTTGSIGGFTTVRVTGTAFTGPLTVDFGTQASRIVTVLSSTALTAVAPAGSAGTVGVTVTTSAGTSVTTPADQFTYVAPPTVTGVNPASGPATGGTSVTITGSGFVAGTMVRVGNLPASGVVVDAPTQITATTPPGNGVADVTVTTPYGTSPTSSADHFTYTPAPAPTVTQVNPDTGSTVGGTPVTLTGTGFTGATAAYFGGGFGTGLTVVSDTEITVTSPASAAGTVDVTVVTPTGASATTSADQFTYVAPPTVTALAPPTGAESGGTPVTLTGAGFVAPATVDFGTTAADTVVVVSSTEITVKAPPGTGTVAVTVTTPYGTSTAGSTDEFHFVPPPQIEYLVPKTGPAAGGYRVFIAGADLETAQGVSFGPNPSPNVTVISSGELVATAPAGTGTVDVTVTTSGGTSGSSSADEFTYVPAPSVTRLSPAGGPEAGGNVVTITGTGLAGATAVAFGGISGGHFTVVSDDQIIATVPAGTGTVDVTVTTTAGTSTAGPGDRYTYLPAPAVSSVGPSSGPAAGGTNVTITGTGFAGATVVTFGGQAAVFTVGSATGITATAPPDTGTVDVVVTTLGGASAITAADRYTYVAPPRPVVTSLSQPSGPAAGGTTVTITGSGFTGTTAVTFGSRATTYTVTSDTEITATVPAGTGTVDVSVTGPGGTSATGSADRYRYFGAPTVTGISPSAAPATGGRVVTITGTGFTAFTWVSFNGRIATGVTQLSATAVTAIVPPGSGAVNVSVFTAGGFSPPTPANLFTYLSPPAVTLVSPNSGRTSGGSAVTVFGTGLTGATAVTFGSTPATYAVVSSTQLVATAPPGTGTVDVTVTTPTGTSPVLPADQFTYAVPSPSGYWEVASDGGIFAFGDAAFYGSMGGQPLNKPVVGIAATPDGHGYWEVASDGGIFAFGDAAFYGSMGGQPLNKPVVGIAATPDGHGYWEVASDGGIFAFGDAAFYGSMGGQPLNRPVVGIAATPDGHGYWEVASDGGIFAFGDAAFYGSMGGQPLNKPVVGIAATPDGHGYWEVASDGGIFAFGDAAFYGSMGGQPLNKPVVGIAGSSGGPGAPTGYWEVASDGGLFAFGGAPFDGSMGGTPLNQPVVGIAGI